jgi:hypothetical protein
MKVCYGRSNKNFFSGQDAAFVQRGKRRFAFMLGLYFQFQGLALATGLFVHLAMLSAALVLYRGQVDIFELAATIVEVKRHPGSGSAINQQQ